jgi:acylphosphatase
MIYMIFNDKVSPGDGIAMKRLHVFIGGRVQGVFFRARTRDTARRLGLSGWVRNLSDGRVEALFEGEEEQLRSALAWCRTGPPRSRPEAVDARWVDGTGEFSDFEIRY